MNRRQLLQQLAGGGAALIAGCASLGEEPGSFNFGIVNRREQSYHARYTLWDDADEVLVNGFVDIAPSPPDDGEYTALHFDSLTRVTNGDTIEVRIRSPARRSKKTYEVTCNQSENAQNDSFFYIRRPGAPTTSEMGMEFGGSEC